MRALTTLRVKNPQAYNMPMEKPYKKTKKFISKRSVFSESIYCHDKGIDQWAQKHFIGWTRNSVLMLALQHHSLYSSLGRLLGGGGNKDLRETTPKKLSRQIITPAAATTICHPNKRSTANEVSTNQSIYRHNRACPQHSHMKFLLEFPEIPVLKSKLYMLSLTECVWDFSQFISE